MSQDERMSIGNKLNAVFPQTSSTSGVVIVGAAFSSLLLFNPEDPSKSLKEWAITIIGYVGLFLLIVSFLVLIFEALSKFIPALRTISTLLLKIPRLIAAMYVVAIKLLIKQAVSEIVESKKHIGDSFTLKTQRHDDDYWDTKLNFKGTDNYVFVVTPQNNPNYWRIGFKFSSDEFFKPERLAKGQPLFHLTKDDDTRLKVTYYDKESRHIQQEDNNVIINDYHNESVMLILDKKDAKLRIRVANTNKEDVFSIKLDIDDHAWAELFAWGDGRDYALGVEQTKKYRLVKHD